MSARPPRVLFVPLELGRWARARQWSYVAHFGVEDGLLAAGVECFTLPSTWLARAPALCRGRRFDQVWVEAVHAPLTPAVLAWLAEQAPVRVALLGESLSYDARALAAAPHLATRRQEIEARVPSFTHVLAVDEADAADIAARKLAHALWWPQAVPERFIRESPGAPAVARGVFGGALYGERADWLARAAAGGRLARAPSVEGAATARAWDAIHRALRGAHRLGLGGRLAHAAYRAALRRFRRRAFRGWLDTLARHAAVVDLPHFVKAYPGRVYEGMAAGRPVVAWEVPERPRLRALFEDGAEILLYRDADGLASALDRVLHDSALAERLAAAARRRLLARDTAERRVAGILGWLDGGPEPDAA